MPHRIEVFSANCPLCNKIVDEIEAGRCAGCQLIVYNLAENLELARSYGVRVVPTVIIDGEVKIEGRPDIPFVCSDETYAHFKERYPLTIQLTPWSDEKRNRPLNCGYGSPSWLEGIVAHPAIGERFSIECVQGKKREC